MPHPQTRCLDGNPFDAVEPVAQPDGALGGGPGHQRVVEPIMPLHANVLEAMAAAQSTGVQEGGGSDLTPLEAAADVPSAQAAGAGGAFGGDLFEMAEDTLRIDQVDASDGVTGTPHE